jgi:hypothetical protein
MLSSFENDYVLSARESRSFLEMELAREAMNFFEKASTHSMKTAGGARP